MLEYSSSESRVQFSHRTSFQVHVSRRDRGVVQRLTCIGPSQVRTDRLRRRFPVLSQHAYHAAEPGRDSGEPPSEDPDRAPHRVLYKYMYKYMY
jgi:hypothetical protein